MMTLKLFLLIHPYKKLKIIFEVDLVTEELMKTTKITFNVKDLNLWYGNFHALKNLDMLIPQKEVTAIIGPSGCGKSTFVKTLNLMIIMVLNVNIVAEINFNKANILINKFNVVNLSKQIGVIFQNG